MPATRRPIDGPFAWTGETLAKDENWRMKLDKDRAGDIRSAVERFVASGRHWSTADRNTLPLPGIDEVCATMQDELETGRGLYCLSGVPVDGFDADALRALYLSFGDHVGTPVSQNVDGDRIMGIEDEGAKATDYGTLGTGGAGEFRSSRARAFSSGGLRFHTDRCDVVSLLCVRQAVEGGHSRLASAVAIHNAMLERAPDLLEELFTDYPRSRFGEEVKDVSVHYMLPVFAERDGKFTTHYSRTYIEAAQTNEAVPRLRPEQDAALDLLNELAGELSYVMTLAPGDIQLLNNHVVYHARDPYQDDAPSGRRRLLYRLWLAMENSRPLPESYEVLFGHTEPGAVRGGIWPPDRAYELPL